MCMVVLPVAAESGAAPAPAPKPRSRRQLRQLEDILFDTCTDCHRSQAKRDAFDMSAIPQGMLAARVISANNAKKPEASTSELALEHPPLKYNSKLMNSIWGLYNRYSVHNFKKNTDDEAFVPNNFGSQQKVLMATAGAPINGALLESFCLQ